MYTRRKYSSGSGSGWSVGKGREGGGKRVLTFIPRYEVGAGKSSAGMFLGWKEGFVILLYVVYVYL